MDKCAIWDVEAEVLPSQRDGTIFISPRAGGEYFISGSVLSDVKRLDERTRARLTTWLGDQRRLGNQRPEITTAVLSEARVKRALTVTERLDGILLFLHQNAGSIGATTGYIPGDNVHKQLLAWSESTTDNELRFLLSYLVDRGFLTRQTLMNGGLYGLTVEGHARLGELQRTGADSPQAFVAMWFDASMSEAYAEGVAPAVRRAGYEPLRIDEKSHNNKIDDEIILEIRRSRFLISDFTQGETGARGGVYYEAGFAHGLGLPVIFTCRSNALSSVHFDTRQYNHIAWSEPNELQVLLYNRIMATLGKGPK